MEAVLMHRLRLRLLAALTLSLATIAGAAAAPAQTFSVDIARGRAKGNDTLKVRKGDQVQLRFTSDQPIVLHLHGYDLQAKVAPPAPALLTFKADLPGRFPVHEHRHGPGSHHRAVLFIEVHP
jgi:FtsP/CotA-like multicopper oxidase with cupredoxin domain